MNNIAFIYIPQGGRGPDAHTMSLYFHNVVNDESVIATV